MTIGIWSWWEKGKEVKKGRCKNETIPFSFAKVYETFYWMYTYKWSQSTRFYPLERLVQTAFNKR